MRRCIMRKNWCTVFNVKVTVRACVIKYDYFYYILLTVSPFAAKLGLIIQHYELEGPVEKIGLLHSRSRSQ